VSVGGIGVGVSVGGTGVGVSVGAESPAPMTTPEVTVGVDCLWERAAAVFNPIITAMMTSATSSQRG
jgi:hypothetical protein